jgi:thiosulfate/3-mercaptopyruvate sulfurtransferase
MSFRTVIDTTTLSQHLDDPAFAVVDCRFKLDDPGWGERAYLDRHLPGAVYAHLNRDLAGPTTGANGRHPLPDPSALVKTFTRLGIGDRTQVVTYDQDAGMYASRLWWLLRWMGHADVAVLDGGFPKWIAEGRPTASGPESPRTGAATQFSGSPRSEMTADRQDVARLMSNPEWRLLDARAPERYRGDAEPIDRVPGHIPSAINHFFRTNLDEQGALLPREMLQQRLADSLAGVPADHVVCYCGSGVTACQNLLALEHAGMPGAKLYAGSWSEWSSDPERPIERS